MQPSMFHFTHLTPTEEANPYLTLHRFCMLMPLCEVRLIMHNWLMESLSAEDTIYEEAAERSQLLLMYNQLLSLIDAAYKISYSPNSYTT
ncbi:hypothetical protein [Chitinophaga sp. HK235]|uniref:hypothetical protein n=1 Tax=Chitinophaga sp. HK235 TaxID=2952571 RepID=UPI001BAB8492|nr:hypothetical protein [Chitinophaga sp. HK235]